jgi:protein TonB
MALRTAQLDPDPHAELDPFRGPALQSLALHAGIVGALLAYALIASHLHGNNWGNNSVTQGAIQATMVSSAPAIPLPRDEQKPSDNVLATETPSPAPAPPAPKAPAAQEEKSIPIPIKEPVKTKLQPKKQVEQKQPVQHIPVRAATAAERQQVRPNNRANYGEAAPATPRSMAAATPGAQVNVQGGDFGSRFPWYVDVIRRKTAQNWYKQEVDPGTPDGSRVFLSFSVSRSGEPSGVRIAQSSGSPTLDTSCVRAVQRVDTYGPLPSGYSGSSLQVSYYCEQSGR